MAKACHSLVALAATFSLAMGQTMSGPGPEAGTNYFWPRYNYTNADLKYTSKLTLDTPYVCKWDVTIPGMNMAQDILVLPPCTYITPHWHPDTYELNFILEGNLTYWIFPYGKPAEPTPPLHGNVPQGSALVSPLGVMHLLYNDECDKLAMMHSFPTSTNEDFFSVWGNQKEMPETYLNNVMPQSPGGASMIEGLNIPDNVHTLSQQCMQRCGLSQQYYDNLKCPTEALEQKVIKPLVSDSSPLGGHASANAEKNGPTPAPTPAPTSAPTPAPTSAPGSAPHQPSGVSIDGAVLWTVLSICACVFVCCTCAATAGGFFFGKRALDSKKPDIREAGLPSPAVRPEEMQEP